MQKCKKGAKAVKMKIGGASIGIDLDRIDAVRVQLGQIVKSW